jgi:hypothetical protein
MQPRKHEATKIEVCARARPGVILAVRSLTSGNVAIIVKLSAENLDRHGRHGP